MNYIIRVRCNHIGLYVWTVVLNRAVIGSGKSHTNSNAIAEAKLFIESYNRSKDKMHS